METRYQSLCPGCFREKGSPAICPHCGYDESIHRSPLVLPHRCVLQGQYLIGRVLGKPGGFGITYLALDVRLEAVVAIKEYLPRDLAGRETGELTVGAHSPEDRNTFRFGLEQFLREARTLAKFDHAHVVKVRNVFEENGTAYLVMDYYEGLTLAEYLQRQGRLGEDTAVDLLMCVLDGLREVHEKGFLHRDIKPQNIYLTAQGRPILLDFGSARVALGERSKSLSIVLTPGYAPFEQYQSRSRQGAWTDIYSCAAVLYQMLTGTVPPEAPDRADQDPLQPPQELARGLSPQLAEAILRGLAFKPADRPQSVREFQEQLRPRVRKADNPIPTTSQRPVRPSPLPWALAGIGLLALVLWLGNRPGTGPSTPMAPAAPSLEPSSNAVPWRSQPAPEPEVPATPVPAAQAEAVVRAYYAALGRRDVEGALSQWKNPSRKPLTLALIRNTQYAQLRDIKAEAPAEDRAEVWVDVSVKALDRAEEERWQGTIELEAADEGRWGIVKMNLLRVGDEPPRASSSSAGDRLVSRVRDYFSALDRNDQAQAESMWKSAPRKLGALVQNVEYFKLNDVRVEAVADGRAAVWVDVSGKSRDQPGKRYRGTVDLEGDSGDWLIVSTKNLKEIP